MAKIDILLPVKNGINFFAESLDSICNQSFKDWRLIVLDHGSVDGSLELAEDYRKKDGRVEVHSIPNAEGLSGLLNCGLDLADCEYVMRHDADDVCFPDRMDVVLDAFSVQKECVAIGGQADVIDSKGMNIGSMKMPIGQQRVAAASMFRNPVPHPASMLKFKEIKKMGIRYGIDFINILPTESRIEVPALAEDYFLFGQLSILGKCTNVPNKLIKYRWHGNNVSATKFDDQMKVSLLISRYLVNSFCAMHSLPPFDPAPFCNHGGILFDVDGRKEFREEFKNMTDVLRKGFHNADEIERELQFRYLTSTRNELSLIWRYLQFSRQFKIETGEWNAVRSWLLRKFPGKPYMEVTSL